MLHAGERMLVAALPESFESVADHLGVLLGKRGALGGSVGDLRLERDAGGDHRQRLKRGIGLDVSKRRMFVIPLRGDYGFGDATVTCRSRAVAAFMAVPEVRAAPPACTWVTPIDEPSPVPVPPRHLLLIRAIALGARAAFDPCKTVLRLSAEAGVAGRVWEAQERGMPANGGYGQAFGLKKQARVACHP
jgi:hypothetical protein